MVSPSCRVVRTVLVTLAVILIVSFVHVTLQPIKGITHLLTGQTSEPRYDGHNGKGFQSKMHQTLWSVDWRDVSQCTTSCTTGTPCVYNDEVDFRIILITYNRAHSTKNCLEAISHIDTMGKRVSVEVWIDSLEKNSSAVDSSVFNEAKSFADSWKGGRVCIHKQDRKALIIGQWIDTWRPWSADTKEIAVFLEDDVDIAQQALRYLSLVHRKYDTAIKDIAGYSLQMEESSTFLAGKHQRLVGPKSDPVFLYRILGTWGFSPHAQHWRDFQDWFHSKDPKLKPYVEGITPTSWYKTFEQRHTEQHMWSMWHIYYTHTQKQFTMYCNLHYMLNSKTIKLASNRREAGLHYGRGSKTPTKVNFASLMQQWDDAYGKLPSANNITRLDYGGSVMKQ